jgi:thiol-disulfide isomerase/thioredoxin
MSSNPSDKQASEAANQGLPMVVYAAVGLFFAVIGFGAVYVTAGGADNLKGSEMETAVRTTVAPVPPPEPAAQAPVVAQASPPAELPSGPGRNPLSVGEMAKFVFKPAPEALPKVAFLDADGKERTLDDWKGKVVLLNLWATWCVPCRKEMPGLDRLQAEMRSDKFEVIAVSVDRTGTAGAKKFLDQIKVENIAVLADPTARMAATLRAVGLPATILINADGLEVGRLLGEAEWNTPEAKALIKAVVK